MPGSVLYISYDGMLEPLGQSQVLAYLERLANDREIHLLSYEKRDDWHDTERRQRVSARIASAGIHWHPRRYHKSPSVLATAYDIGVGALAGLWLTLLHRIRIVHARSDIPALMAWVVKMLTGVKFIYDMRGFWADERVDGNLWRREGRLYRVAKWLESRFLLSADHVVSLTNAAIKEMEKFPFLAGRMPPITVIPTCADLELFRPMQGLRSDSFVLGYVGSAGTWYVFDAVVDCFAHLRRLYKDARLLIVNRNEHEYIKERLVAGSVPVDAVELLAASHADIPLRMARMHAGVFFIKPVFSKQASAPTKLAEFLGCGIPCLANAGVGDMAEILETENVGIALRSFDPVTLKAGVESLLGLLADADIRERCVAAARRHFSLEQGVASYASIYRLLDQAVC